MAAPGRNDPCPCGSGKKYKRCCLGKEHSRADFERELHEHGLPLLRELARFATRHAGATPESVAAERFPFWRPPLDRARASRLVDYLIFDFRPSRHGRTAAQAYLAERGPVLPSAWRLLLERWQDTGIGLFVVEQWSGGFARCKQLLPDEGRAIEVLPLEDQSDRPADGAALALRALPIASAFACPASPISFGTRDADDVRAAIVARHHAFVRSERIVGMEEFLRLDGTALDEEAASAGQSQIIVPGRR